MGLKYFWKPPSLPCSPEENGGLCPKTIVQGRWLAVRSASSHSAWTVPMRSVSSATKWASPQSNEYQRSAPAAPPLVGRSNASRKGLASALLYSWLPLDGKAG